MTLRPQAGCKGLSMLVLSNGGRVIRVRSVRMRVLSSVDPSRRLRLTG